MENKIMRKGLTFGLLVGLAWGLDSVLMGVLGGNPIFGDGIASTLVAAFFHDGFAFFWLVLLMLCTKQIKQVIKLMKTPAGKATMLAAIIGAPIGMSGYVLGLKYATPAYASSISVIYPGVGAILAYLVLKEKLTKPAIIGIIVSLFGSAMLGFTGASSNTSSQFLLGVAFTLVAVIAWASEGVIVAYAMKKLSNNNTVEEDESRPSHFLTLRYLVSAVTYGLVIIPMIGGYDLAGEIVSSELFLGYAGVAILGVITYLSWYKAVSLIGGAMGTALNSTSAFWAVIFSAILLGAPINLSQALWCGVIILGVFIFAVGPNLLLKKK